MKKVFLYCMLLLCALIVGSSSVWGTDYSYTFSSQQYSATGAQTLGGVSWTMAGTGGSYFGYDGTKGQQFGSGTKPFSVVSLTTSGISGTITSVAVNTSGAKDIVGTVSVSVGGTAFECNSSTTISLTSTATAYTFTHTGASGDVVISWAQTSSKAIYVKSITVTYSTGGGSEPSITLGSNSVNAPETAVSTTSIEVTYNNLTNYEADVVFYEANGTDAATYDHSWLTAEINATTMNLDYSITANTSAARTAYLRVYAVGDEGDVESGLITITQAKKSVTSPVFNLEGGDYMQGTNITISSTGNTVYYNLTTNGSTPVNPTNASTEYTAPIVLGSGTTKIKAIAYDTYGNASSVVSRTYTGIALASLPFSWTGTDSKGKADLAGQTGVSVNLGSDYATSNAPYRLKFDGEGKCVVIYTDKKPENVYFTAKLFNAASTGSKIKVQGSADGINFTDVEEFTVKGAANATFVFSTSSAFAPTHRAVKLLMSSKDQNVAVGTICVSCVPIAISTYEWATYVTPYALDFTGLESSIKAYIVTDHNAGWTAIEKTQMTGTVPAGTPLLLEGVTTNVPVVASSSTDVSENKLQAGTGAAISAEANKTKYVLGVNNNSTPDNASDDYAEFQKIVSTAATVPVGKAYLLFNEASAAPSALRLEDEENNATNVETIESADKAVKFIQNGQLLIKRDGIVYDALGRVVK